MQPMEVKGNLELWILQKLNHFHHKTVMTKGIFVKNIVSFFAKSKEFEERSLAEPVRKRILMSDLWDRLLISGIIKNNSPSLFDRNRLHEVLDGDLFISGLPKTQVIKIKYTVPLTPYSDVDD